MLLDKVNIYARIIAIALFSRTLVILLSYIPTLIFELFDKSTLLLTNTSPFKHLIVWDAVHFLRIADHGYYYEHSIPFFPLVPFMARAIPIVDNATSGVLLCNFAFIVSAALMYKISLKVYSHRIAYLSTIFFIFNPASIVYSSFYSEPIFSMLFLMALYYLQAGRMLRASTFLGLCSLARSNTVMFLLFLKAIYFPIVVAPFALYQLYNLLLIMRLKVSFKFLIPYSYIQVVYWGHGFFKFIRPWNIPNILFGLLPIIYGLFVCIKYFESRLYLYNSQFTNETKGKEIKSNLDGNNKTEELLIGNGKLTAKQWIVESFFSLLKRVKVMDMRDIVKWVSNPFYIETTSVATKLAIILSMQMITVICFIHWNMAFRFISFNPLLYWAFAVLFDNYYYDRLFRMAACAFFVYGIVYAILFGCFYPPA
ncbi:GPI mannosyltransferase 2 [Pancytospora epiphaga]|nr:GPI mannosyltransferase 2 [Pancytospora epiphaga]